MQLDLIRTFREVFERRSFGASARALGVDASVVSRRVKALEAELDVALFLRTTRSVAPTDAAEAFYGRITPALEAIDEAVLQASAARDRLRGTIRVAAPSALGRICIAPVIHRFCAAHPEVRVELLLSDRRIDLFEEGIHIAIRPGDAGAGGLVARVLGTSSQWLVASAAYVSVHGVPTADPASLAGHRLVLRREGGALQDLRLMLPEEVRDAVGVGFVTDDVGATADAVRAGLGIGMLPRWLAEDEVAQGRLERLPLGPGDIRATVYAVLPAGRRTVARARALLEALVEDWGAAPG